MSPEPSLIENLSTALESMSDNLLDDFCDYVNIPEMSEIRREDYGSYYGHKLTILIYLESVHPALSWRLVANALYKMGMNESCDVADSCHRALEHLQQPFPTGNVRSTSFRVVIFLPGWGHLTLTQFPIYKYRHVLTVVAID